jgi:hypothetical protein
MTKTNKKFDCVEMKNAIQQQLRQEYERRKNEFASYVDFINSTVNESDEIRRFREKLTKPSHA